jgi:hypothetical protein
MKNVSISLNLSIDELAFLLGVLEQVVEGDQRGVPKQYTIDAKSTYKKFVEIAEKIESGIIKLN